MVVRAVVAAAARGALVGRVPGPGGGWAGSAAAGDVAGRGAHMTDELFASALGAGRGLAAADEQFKLGLAFGAAIFVNRHLGKSPFVHRCPKYIPARRKEKKSLPRISSPAGRLPRMNSLVEISLGR